MRRGKDRWYRAYPGWIRWVLIGWFALAILAPFVANERGLVIRYREEIHFPVFHQWESMQGSSHTRITCDSDCMNIRRTIRP